MEYLVRLQKLCQMETRKLVLLMAIIGSIVLLFQSFTLAHRSVQVSVSPAVDVKFPMPGQNSFLGGASAPKFLESSELHPLDVSTKSSVVNHVIRKSESPYMEGDSEGINRTKEMDVKLGNGLLLEEEGALEDFDIDEDEDMDNDFQPGKDDEMDNLLLLEQIREPNLNKSGDSESNSSLPKASTSFYSGKQPETSVLSETIQTSELTKIDSKKGFEPSPVSLATTASNMNVTANLDVYSSDPVILTPPHTSSTSKGATTLLSRGENTEISQTASEANLTLFDIPISKMKHRGSRIRSIPEMNHILRRSHLSRAMKPLRSSVRDREILSAKAQVENAPIVKDDPDLYPPLFRNVSQFKRSYELMERILKVYVYKDGEKPIFHTPLLKGIYASEGWFMKLMERNKNFVVKDPRKAHLFYLPFSTRLLEFALHKRGLIKQDMAEYLKKYASTIATKYPFWYRTGGADHFLVACHDWAPYETKPHLVSAIRALCNADLYEGFKIGKDVSLPETYVRSARDPLRDLGGNPASKRQFLAFFAGNMHGWVRPVLLKYWENKDPNMKIFGPMPSGVRSKMTYIHYMKNSKFCICPRGYEVNSPRVVEAIFYECVPVIISDNFVPPFFEVLNWEAFAVFVAEKDIPNLRDILLSIPHERYLTMQMRVKKLQRHFLWHNPPVKYDIFHMILHSIWLNRLNQIRV
ncbi:probable glycosyltransferase At5g03795 [Aristolochia californica]|uniref:probable glycosyltransferase At5g03795 n=1 Tax=Aristolochia californica TaxID=171875 RepID=UPI0035E006F9